MRLADHVTLHLNNNMSTAAVFLDIDKAFNTKWHSGLLYKLSELEFSAGVIKLISSFLTDRKFKVLVEGEFSTSRIIAAGVPQGSVVAPVLYSLYTMNGAPVAPGTHFATETRTLCSLQTAAWTYSHKFVV
jgi:hypothetical protein